MVNERQAFFDQHTTLHHLKTIINFATVASENENKHTKMRLTICAWKLLFKIGWTNDLSQPCLIASNIAIQSSLHSISYRDSAKINEDLGMVGWRDSDFW